jgi:hypothetical protein
MTRLVNELRWGSKAWRSICTDAALLLILLALGFLFEMMNPFQHQVMADPTISLPHKEDTIPGYLLPVRTRQAVVRIGFLPRYSGDGHGVMVVVSTGGWETAIDHTRVGSTAISSSY